MFQAGERLPETELKLRHARCRQLLAALQPRAGGLLVSGHPSIYYFTGTLANGIFWLPCEGEPVLAVRKAPDRAKLESPLRHVISYSSYRELASALLDLGSPFSHVLAVEQNVLSWEQGLLLASRLPGHRFVGGDVSIARTRAVKSEWELAKLRIAGERHCRGMRRMLPERIQPGLSELAISHELWNCFFSLGHCGPEPTGLPGVTVFLGNVTAGLNSLYPNAFNGPLGIKGVHPAAPVMGHPESIWQPGELLAVDVGFNFEGYLTDKTEIYFAGKEKDIPALARRAQDLSIRIEADAAAALKPGAIPAKIYQASLAQAAAGGFGEGYMGLGADAVPFLGHGIGLTVSEWPILAHGFTEPLQQGMVIALEPKISLPGLAMVGVENTYEITAEGARCLTGTERNIICV